MTSTADAGVSWKNSTKPTVEELLPSKTQWANVCKAKLINSRPT